MTDPRPGGLATITPRGPVDLATGELRQKFVALDRYAEDSYVIPQGLPTLAKISAGYKNPETGYPVVSRDGTIYLSDPDNRAPKLAEALTAADQARRGQDGKIKGSMRLRIALPFDEIDDNLQQNYVRYSAGRLEAQGNGEHITELVVTKWRSTKGGGQEPAEVERHTYYRDDRPKTIEYADGTEGHLVVDAGSFKRLKRSCQVVWNLLFTLGEWVGEGDDAWAHPILVDGLGVYRLTSTSRKGLNDVGQYLELVSTLCNGQLRGAVLDLMLTYPPVSDPLGVRRSQVPRWTLLFKPPSGIKLDPRRWQALAAGMLHEGSMLALPKPRPETWQEVEQDMRDLVEPETEVLDQLLSGDLPAARQEEYWRREFFGQVQGSTLATDQGRKAWLLEHTQGDPGSFRRGRTDSLAWAIQHYTNAEMQALVTAAAEFAARERLSTTAGGGRPTPLGPAAQAVDPELEALREKARRYDELFAAQGMTDEPLVAGTGVPAPQAQVGRQPTRTVPTPQVSGMGTVEPRDQGQPPPPPAAADPSAVSADATPPSASEATAVEASPAAVPPPAAGVGPDTNGQSGRPVDSPGVQARSREDVERELLAELRPDIAGGEVFSCAQCGRQIGSVTTDEETLPARVWLRRLAEQGIDRVLCRDDARTEILRQRRARSRKGDSANG